MFLADSLAITSVPNLSRLVVHILLANVVFTDQVWSTAISSVAKVAFTSKCAVALLQNERIQRYGCSVGETRIWWCRKVSCPVKIAACRVGASKDVLEGHPRGVLRTQWVDSRCKALI
jgi:hypothetical protein